MPYKRGNPLGGAHYRDRDACSKGHTYVEGSWYMSRPNGAGHSWRRCLVCDRERQRARKSPERQLEQSRAASIRRARARLSPEEFEAWEADIVAKWQKQQNLASNPMNYLALKGDAQEALDDLNKAMETQRTNCFERPEDFMDFDDPRYPDEWDAENLRPVPDTEKRKLLCEDCPLSTLFGTGECGVYAAVAKPDFGLYDGELYVGGKKA